MLSELRAEAGRLADAMHDRVIEAALRRAPRCRRCRYEANAYLFRCLLLEYESAKRHACRCRGEIGEASARAQASMLRARLADLWPCPRCLQRYNPTNRRAYGGHELPRATMPKLERTLI